MGEKRKNPIIENDDNVDGNLAKKRKKSFQQDIRLCVATGDIVTGIAGMGLKDGLGTAEQRKHYGHGVATDFPNTTLPVPTQCVATREIVTGLESMELKFRFGTATLTQTVTRILEIDTLPKQNTEIVLSRENVPTMEIEKSENMLGTAPQTQEVTGEVTRLIGFGTAHPMSTHSVKSRPFLRLVTRRKKNYCKIMKKISRIHRFFDNISSFWQNFKFFGNISSLFCNISSFLATFQVCWQQFKFVGKISSLFARFQVCWQHFKFVLRNPKFLATFQVFCFAILQVFWQ